MRVFHGFDALPHFVRPAVTVGSYDGVHLGHRALIGRLIAEARANDGESIVLTFEPHPRITLGYNHRFGHDRIDCDTLAASGRLRVVKVGPCRVDGEHVSSTVIRRLLDEGKTAEAELLLGYSLQTEK